MEGRNKDMLQITIIFADIEDHLHVIGEVLILLPHIQVQGAIPALIIQLN
jgi:hypothetical protein